MMKRTKIVKLSFLVILTGVVIGAGIVTYMYNMPHRDVANSGTDYHISAGRLVAEYLANETKANKKYLDGEGESSIFEITGTVSEISEDFDGQLVVLLKNESDKAGVSCTFTKETNGSVKQLKSGQKVIIKGVIRSGATYDSDLGMYEHVILEKCSLIR